MAFINEKIPEKFINNFDFSIFKDFYGRPITVYPGISMWTRNDDGTVFLIGLGSGGGEHVGAPKRDKYGLYWKDCVVCFWGDDLFSKSEDAGVTTWDNCHISIPENLIHERGEIVAALKEALVTKGTRHSSNPDYNEKVVVNLV